MNKPTIAGRKPAKVELQAGETYHWCSCGKSQNQPFCDGSHRGTTFTPLAFEADETGTAHLCMCKHSQNPPYCDGTHASLPAGGEAAPAPTSNMVTPTLEEPTLKAIHELARDGLSKVGHHGEMGSMGVPRAGLPDWNDIQILPAQFARKPLMDDVAVGAELVIGGCAKKPLVLKMPLFVSDMSFGALSEEAKVALAQ
ncbi:MAG: CDGSH iron-sulfur domain-containing protein, partial [Rhodospirillales bacterium]|nr:CDGSH iron-sulfur domain-containing protein [Rhodospirillales bacterium]